MAYQGIESIDVKLTIAPVAVPAPRAWTDLERACLNDFTRAVSEEIEYRFSCHRAMRVHVTLAGSAARPVPGIRVVTLDGRAHTAPDDELVQITRAIIHKLWTMRRFYGIGHVEEGAPMA